MVAIVFKGKKLINNTLHSGLFFGCKSSANAMQNGCTCREWFATRIIVI
jgi:hypothetical protein